MTRFSAPERSQIPQTFHQVTVAWKHMTHPNIVPLLGVTLDPPQLISDWMPGGDLTEYIAGHPGADRIGLVSDFYASLYETLTPSSAVWCRRRSETPAFAQHNSWQTQRSTRLFLISFNHLIDTQAVEYLCGRKRQCTDHRFRSRRCHSGPRLATVRFSRVWG